ncbi:MAG TPA: hypothetical protein VGX78_20240 [Pirellulales bacterium]|nr:hypothetical protein [Pirellulales bacterium]
MFDMSEPELDALEPELEPELELEPKPELDPLPRDIFAYRPFPPEADEAFWLPPGELPPVPLDEPPAESLELP